MEAVKGVADTQSEMHLSRPDSDMVLLHLSGNWRLQRTLPSVAEVQRQLEAGPPVQRLGFDTQQLTSWDSGLVTFLCGIVDLSTRHRITPDQTGLPGRGAALIGPRHSGARAPGGPSPSHAGSHPGPDCYGDDRHDDVSGSHTRIYWRRLRGLSEATAWAGPFSPHRPGFAEDALVSRKSRFRVPAGTQEYRAIVAAMSQTIADLSREIAEALRVLATPTASCEGIWGSGVRREGTHEISRLSALIIQWDSASHPRRGRSQEHDEYERNSVARGGAGTRRLSRWR